ncbi:MAG: carbamoyltransferase HypF, partial [Actinomycetota bacterium]
RGVACVPTTSMGRLFDAVASLLGLRQAIDFEAQAAIDLEIAAVRWTGPVPTYSFDLRDGSFDQRPVLRAIVDDLASDVPVEAIASGFHDAVAAAVVVIATELRAAGAGDVVALSGGVFQNAVLVERCTAALTAAGLTALTHHLVPPNDGGLALGQAFVATHAASPDRLVAAGATIATEED